MKFIMSLLALLVALECFCTETPGITVVFDIKEQKYLAYYGDETPQLEAALADSVSSYLRSNFPLFNFQAQTRYHDTLYIEIARKNAHGSSVFFDVILNIRISGGNVKAGSQSIVWSFAPRGKYFEYITSDVEFVQKVFNQFQNTFDREQMITEIFKHRWITEGLDGININWSKNQWELNFTFNELKIGVESQLKIMQEHLESQAMLRKFFVEVKNIPSANSRIITEILASRKIGSEICDDISVLQKNTYKGVIGIQIMKLTPFFELGTVVAPSNSGI